MQKINENELRVRLKRRFDAKHRLEEILTGIDSLEALFAKKKGRTPNAIGTIRNNAKQLADGWLTDELSDDIDQVVAGFLSMSPSSTLTELQVLDDGTYRPAPKGAAT